MRCDQLDPYLPGYAGGDLRAETTQIVESHLQSCASCRARAAMLARVTHGLASLRSRDVEPPAYLVDAVLETVRDRKRRVIPLLPPNVPGDIVRLVNENREQIASAAGAVVLTAGAAYALWRALRSRPSGQPTTA